MFCFCRNNPIGLIDVFGKLCCDKCNPEKEPYLILYEGASLKAANRALSSGTVATAKGILDDIEALSYLQVSGGILSAIASTKGMAVDVLLSAADSLIDEGRISGYKEKILAALDGIENGLQRIDGIVIWVHIKWKQCEEEKCLSKKRYNWKEHEEWRQCSAGNRPQPLNGFDVNDVSDIARAIYPCIKEIRNEIFK